MIFNLKKASKTSNCQTVVFLVLAFWISSTNYSKAQAQPLVLTKEQALQDFKWLRFALEYVHPRLYKYEDKKTVDARFDSLNKQIKTKISGLDFLALVSKANAAVHCGHLYTIPQGKLSEEILEKKVLPFHIKVLGDKLYLMNDCSHTNIPDGSQILSINGKSVEQIINLILPGIATDGFIQTRKFRLMERYFYSAFHGFDLYYQLYVDRSKVFKVEYVNYGSSQSKTVTVDGVSLAERTSLLMKKFGIDEMAWFKDPSPQFEMDRQHDFAILTVSRSFYDKTIDPEFNSFIKEAFDSLKKKKVRNLILDLRDNEGGDEHQQMELMSYLYSKPFKLYQNIYLSHLDFRPLKSIITERDTSNLLFNNEDEYMRRINDHLWINNYEYDDNLILREPSENVFTGQLYVLMNGLSFSSAADLIADLKKTTNAVFIGEESGGAFEGPTGGSTIAIQLPNSKIMVRISPNIHTGYMYQKHPVGRGVLPTHVIDYTIRDVIEKKDLEMELAKDLILKKSADQKE